VHAGLEPRSPDSPSNDAVSSISSDNLLDEERAVGASSVGSHGRSSTTVEEETELRTRRVSFTSSVKRKTSQLLEAVRSSPSGDSTLTPKLAQLVESYSTSEVAQSIKAETEEVATAQRGADASHAGGELRDVVVEISLLRGRKRASWGTQFTILSGRAFKNLYRDPALLAAHYLSSVVLACEPSLFLVVSYTHMPFHSDLWPFFP
jgi:hypothetical protein